MIRGPSKVGVLPYLIPGDGYNSKYMMRVRSSLGFSLLELLVSIAIVAVLLSMLIPLLSRARDTAYKAVCSNNLRQMSVGWLGYVQDHNDTFPVPAALPQWTYGGVRFQTLDGGVAGVDMAPVLDATRPINRYLTADVVSATDSTGQSANANAGGRDLAKIFHCPSDAGVFETSTTGTGVQRVSILGQAGGQTCYEFFGNSYRANSNLFVSIETSDKSADARPLRMHDIMIDTSRFLISGDPVWYYANQSPAGPEARMDASWHREFRAGNFLASDGSIRFTNFTKSRGVDYELQPRH